MDVYPGKADLQDFVNWVSQHVVGHASTEGQGEAPSRTSHGTDRLLPMQRYPDYSECLGKASDLSFPPHHQLFHAGFFCSGSNPNPGYLQWPRSVLPLHLPNIHHIPLQLFQPTASKHTLPGIPYVLLGTGQKLLAQAGLDTLETVRSSLTSD